MSGQRWHLLPGDLLRGYCGGYFGRDSYDDKRVEAVGADWVVVREEHGELQFACGVDVHERLLEFLPGGKPLLRMPTPEEMDAAARDLGTS